MSINHHPDISTLLSCAAGSQPEAMAAVVASHIAMCSRCAEEVGRMQEIGVVLFDELPPCSVESDAPVARARAENPEAEEAGRKEDLAQGDIPAHLARLIGSNLDTVPWRRIAPAIWQYRLPLSKGAAGSLRLVKIGPGVEMPHHGHAGEELTLILKGSYTDEIGTFRRGDVADLDPDTSHRPVADQKAGCVCLIASEKKVLFDGLIARLLQPLIGI